MENFQFLVSNLSIARQDAVSQKYNFLTNINFIWFCGKNLGDSLSLVKCPFQAILIVQVLTSKPIFDQFKFCGLKILKKVTEIPESLSL